MKVKSFFNRMNMSSNVRVYIYDVSKDVEYRIFHDELRYKRYYKYDSNGIKFEYGELTILGFTVRDELTVYVDRDE